MNRSNLKSGMALMVALFLIGSSLLSIGSAQFVKNKNINDNKLSFPVEKPLFTRETYMVEMRDGIHLATDVYLPDGGSSPHGTILVRTPYNKNQSETIKNAGAWADNGWPFIVQDCRGRFQSEGIDTIFRDAHTDGADSIEWIADQNWSNGKVATIGGSAIGIVQYLMAGADPYYLTCQYIGAATPNLYTTIFPGGQFRKNMIESWLQKQGSTYILPELWAHENYSLEYWTNVSLEDNWQDVNVPAVHLGGWYDCFCQGLLDGFMGYQYNGGSGAKDKSKLIVGPWTHLGFGWSRKQGELKYPENSIDTFSEEYWDEILEQYVLEESNDFDNRYNVVYYVMGDVSNSNAFGNFWRYADDWPPDYVEDEWYFHENEFLSMDYPESYNSLTYNYNPNNPVPTKGGTNLYPLAPTWAGPYDQTSVENRADVLLFTSDKLTEPYEATGPIKARLYVSSNCPDTDFTVKLTDVYPDGRSMLIADGILRMRNRNGCDHWEFMEEGQVYDIEVDLWSTSYIWDTNHKIRVAVSSSNFPRFLANPNTKDAMNQNTDTNIAQNTLYLDTSHPSCIIIPRYNENYAPIRPKIIGPTRGLPGVNYNFSFKSTDPEGEDVYLHVDWGDGTNTDWIGPYSSDEEVTLAHTWSTTKIYTIKAKAKDINEAECEFSNHNINIPRSKMIYNPILLRLLERFPGLFPIIRHLLGLL